MLTRNNLLLVLFGFLLIIFSLVATGHFYWAGFFVVLPFLFYLSYVLISIHKKREKETENCC